jgi:hypothetical protein
LDDGFFEGVLFHVGVFAFCAFGFGGDSAAAEDLAYGDFGSGERWVNGQGDGFGKGER